MSSGNDHHRVTDIWLETSMTGWSYLLAMAQWGYSPVILAQKMGQPLTNCNINNFNCF